MSELLQSPERSRLLHLYAAAGAHQAHDSEALDLLLDQALDNSGPLDLMVAGVLSIAELLRDIAGARQYPTAELTEVLQLAHRYLSADAAPGQTYLIDLLLSGVRSYVGKTTAWWNDDQTCDLLVSPSATLRSLVTLLSAACAWRAYDLGEPAEAYVSRTCLNLAW